MISVQRKEDWSIQFESLADMVRFIDNTPRVWSQNSSRTNEAGRNWDLNAGYDGAVKLARDGWEEGVRTILTNISSLPNKARAERRYSIAGDYADASRAASGDPFNMVRRGNAHRNRPVMTIAVNTIASGGTRADVLAKFGAALVSVIDRLENMGVRVELYGTAGFMGLNTGPTGARSCRVAWLVKGAGDSLDLSAVAFGIGHPAVMRRLAFAVVERSPTGNTYGYGQCAPMQRKHFVDVAPDALCIEGVGTAFYMGQSKTMEEMVKVAEAQLNAASIKLCGEPIAELEAA